MMNHVIAASQPLRWLHWFSKLYVFKFVFQTAMSKKRTILSLDPWMVSWATPDMSGRLPCTDTLSMSRHISTLNYLRSSADTCLMRTRTVNYWLSGPAIMDSVNNYRALGGHLLLAVMHNIVVQSVMCLEPTPHPAARPPIPLTNGHLSCMDTFVRSWHVPLLVKNYSLNS